MHPWGCWNVLSGAEKPGFIFTFILVSLSVQECLSFHNKQPVPSSEHCTPLGWAHGPTARTSALLGIPAPPEVFLEGRVGAECFGPALDMFPPPLSYFSGMVHAEDARSVVEASCACPALPSCWWMIYRCSFSSSSVHIKEILEKGKEHEEISVTFLPTGSQTYLLKGINWKTRVLNCVYTALESCLICFTFKISSCWHLQSA